MDVRLDAGSEVHALDADGFFRRLGLMPFPAVFGRHDGGAYAACSFVKHSTI